MLRAQGALALTAIAAAALSAGCFFGGDDAPPSIQRPSSIPTATPPATLPEPIVVGETQANIGPVTSAAAGEATYVVKPGDTLGGIAAQFGVPPSGQAAWVQEVLRLNGLADATLLQTGVELRLPRVQATPRPNATTAASPTAGAPAPTAVATTAPVATPRPTVTAGAGTYTVVAGDYPLLIAQKLGVPEAQQVAWAEQLMALNGVVSSGLQVGQVLRLPPIPGGSATPTP